MRRLDCLLDLHSMHHSVAELLRNFLHPNQIIYAYTSENSFVFILMPTDKYFSMLHISWIACIIIFNCILCIMYSIVLYVFHTQLYCLYYVINCIVLYIQLYWMYYIFNSIYFFSCTVYIMYSTVLYVFYTLYIQIHCMYCVVNILCFLLLKKQYKLLAQTLRKIRKSIVLKSA